MQNRPNIGVYIVGTIPNVPALALEKRWMPPTDKHQ